MLTEEQRKEVEQSAWVVNAVLKKLGLSKDRDMRQTAYLFLCESRQRFDPTKNTKWTTYAYKDVYLRVRKEQKRQRTYSDRIVCDDEYIGALVADDPALKAIDDKQLIEDVSKALTPREAKVMHMRAQHYTYKEISAVIGFSRATVQSDINNAKTKAREKRRED